MGGVSVTWKRGHVWGMFRDPAEEESGIYQALLFKIQPPLIPAMSMMKSRWMVITHADGQKLKFKFPVQAGDETVVQRIEEVLKQSSVAISAGEGETLFVIPDGGDSELIRSPQLQRNSRAR